jgi:hypothetical protein
MPRRARSLDDQGVDGRRIEAVAAHAGLDVAVGKVPRAATPGLAQGRTIVVRDVAALVRIAETDLSCPTACNRFPAKEPAGPRF